MPGVEQAADNCVFAPKLVNELGELAMLLMGVFNSKVTAVDAQLAPLPVQSLIGAERAMGVFAPVGSAVTRSYGDAIERKTKKCPAARPMYTKSALRAIMALAG